ncbi:MAG: DNA alkylation repair protein [Desulfobacteraceae bacterium]|jgi:3-methyladenine DNA glycosylase AlkD
MQVKRIRNRLEDLRDEEKAKILKKFFKTGPGEYGEGDLFLGIKVPELRKLAKEYQYIGYRGIAALLRAPVHEERLLALLILIRKYAKADDAEKKRIFSLYLNHTRFINNWDLVDVSAEHIVGAFLVDRSKAPLYKLAKSKLLWERRIAIMSTFHFIKNHDYLETLKISKMFLSDREDLIHKGVGWMLREVGKRDMKTEEAFLREHYRKMPRTMLRYAIEKFPESKRQCYLKGEV